MLCFDFMLLPLHAFFFLCMWFKFSIREKSLINISPVVFFSVDRPLFGHKLLGTRYGIEGIDNFSSREFFNFFSVKRFVFYRKFQTRDVFELSNNRMKVNICVTFEYFFALSCWKEKTLRIRRLRGRKFYYSENSNNFCRLSISQIPLTNGMKNSRSHDKLGEISDSPPSTEQPKKN